jgi:hypothetical protein
MLAFRRFADHFLPTSPDRAHVPQALARPRSSKRFAHPVATEREKIKYLCLILGQHPSSGPSSMRPSGRIHSATRSLDLPEPSANTGEMLGLAADNTSNLSRRDRSCSTIDDWDTFGILCQARQRQNHPSTTHANQLKQQEKHFCYLLLFYGRHK